MLDSLGASGGGFSAPAVFVGGVVAAGVLLWCGGTFARLLSVHRAEQQGWSLTAGQEEEEEDEEDVGPVAAASRTSKSTEL